ncbi:MAG TPA: lactate utilization protein [Actinomycetota bacterium]|nr:lactate utilization protein [Actinomycetota bacterium]
MERREFLARVRSRLDPAAARGPVGVPEWAPRIDGNLEERFAEEIRAIDGHAYRAGKSEAGEVLEGILNQLRAHTVLITEEETLPPGVPEAAAASGREVVTWAQGGRKGAARADVGVTSARWAIAETGTVVIDATAEAGRSPSLLPRTHVCFVHSPRLVATTTKFFEALAREGRRSSNVTLITGPSKSADIGNELVQGVHGPGEVHVVLWA